MTGIDFPSESVPDVTDDQSGLFVGHLPSNEASVANFRLPLKAHQANGTLGGEIKQRLHFRLAIRQMGGVPALV